MQHIHYIDTLNDVENSELRSNKIMLMDTKTALLSNLSETIKEPNKDLMDTGVLMEESLKINMDFRRSTISQEHSAMNPMDDSRNDGHDLRRPSTIQEVDEPYMEETEPGN